jgi:hypothetical protein
MLLLLLHQCNNRDWRRISRRRSCGRNSSSRVAAVTIQSALPRKYKTLFFLLLLFPSISCKI